MVPLNLQSPEKPDHGDGTTLEVVGSPWLTIQGEGPYSGRPAVFVRLAGCDLRCSMCDTDYTSDRRTVSTGDLVKDILKEDKPKTGLYVLTGGEPFRQNIRFLVKWLEESGGEVQIETNGTLFCDIGEFSRIVCSPKTPSINMDLRNYLVRWPWGHLKYIVEAGKVDPEDGLPTSVLGEDVRPYRDKDIPKERIYVQPQDDQDPGKNRANIDEAVNSCLKFGYRLSLQTHKIAGVL